MRAIAVLLDRRRRSAGFGAILLLVLLLPNPAAAWLRAGHEATGALAYDVLEQRDPEAIAAVLRLMQAHPERVRFDAQLGDLAGRARDRRIFELMAVWPDAARGGPYDRPDWHQSPRIVSSMRALIPFAFGSAQWAFGHNLAIARDATASEADRAVALCWVLHIVGDMHQPLHTALWMSWRFPFTDAGGQWSWVRASPDADPERLGRFWDAAGHPGELALAQSGAVEAGLSEEPPPDEETLAPDPETAFARWVAHSRELAYEVVYQRGALKAGTSPDSAPVLPHSYVEQARAVSRDQIAAAGHRIGVLLLGMR
ncbi:S1/P1 nuclease [Inquilinus limosus]|uniref:S1/P1 nuclease n=1 Tax=Inquilinus limosus TaxID=171674 RepID=UPI00047891E1|nr:S1/P1 nuclease [Inquilinus limosus]